MKNKEKYKDEIFEIACTGRKAAVSKKGKPIACTYCYLCMFSSSENCMDAFSEWCEAEYIERPTLTNNERKFLEIVDPKFKYIVRNPDEWITFFENKPLKDTDRKCWGCGDNLYLNLFLGSGLFNNVNFDMVQWENEEPWLIEDLKRLEVEENTND